MFLAVGIAQAEEMKIYVVEEKTDGYFSISICSEKDILDNFKKLELTKEEKAKIKMWKKRNLSKTTIASWILEDRFNLDIRQEFIDTKEKFSVCVYDNSYNDRD